MKGHHNELVHRSKDMSLYFLKYTVTVSSGLQSGCKVLEDLYFEVCLYVSIMDPEFQLLCPICVFFDCSSLQPFTLLYNVGIVGYLILWTIRKVFIAL